MTSDQIALAAQEGGKRVAARLDMRKAQNIVKPSHLQEVARLVGTLAETPDRPARSQLSGLLRQVRGQREVRLAIALLEASWQVPLCGNPLRESTAFPSPTPESRSRLAEDIVAELNACLQSARSATHVATIRAAVRERQWHPMPGVRSIVFAVQDSYEVDEAELGQLRYVDGGFDDLRISLARRIVFHRQEQHLPALLDYLTRVVMDSHPIPHERQEAANVLRTLDAEFPRSEAMFALLFRTYVNKYHQPQPRGHLMRALGNYGSEVVNPTEPLHQEEPSDRAPIEHLWSQMVEYGSVEAARALVGAVLRAPPSDLRRVCGFLWTGVKRCAERATVNPSAHLVEAYLQTAMDELGAHELPPVRELVSNLQTVSFGSRNIEDLLEAVLDGRASEEQLQRIRALSHLVFHRLRDEALSATALANRRKNALLALPRAGRVATAGDVALLWRVLLHGNAPPDVQEAIVRAVATMRKNRALDRHRLAIPEELRAPTETFLQQAPPAVHRCLQFYWADIFEAPSFASPFTPAGGNSHD